MKYFTLNDKLSFACGSLLNINMTVNKIVVETQIIIFSAN